jgi:AcrR family transcriptional regulator
LGNFHTVRYVHDPAVRPPAPTKVRILQRALELFSCKGYDGTSVREICEGAEVTKPTLYHFFGSKEGAFHALVDEAFESFRRSMLSGLAPDAPAPERLRRMGRSCFAEAVEHADLVRFVLSIAHNTASHAPTSNLTRNYEELVSTLGGVLQDGILEGSFCAGRTDLRLLILIGAFSEALHRHLIIGSPELTPDLADAIVDTVVNGWTRPA